MTDDETGLSEVGALDFSISARCHADDRTTHRSPFPMSPSSGAGDKVRVYCVAGCDYIVAENVRQAVRCWQRTTSGDRREALEDIREIPKDVYRKYKFFYDIGGMKTTSFPKRIKEVIESGEETIPFFLASSEF